MSIAVVINTCAGKGTKPVEMFDIDGTSDGISHEPVLSSGKVPHSWRAYALQNFILPQYINDPHIGQIVVAGEWHEAPNNEYIYVHVPSEFFGAEDALAQRQAGWEALDKQSGYIVFQHDDHLLDPHWCDQFITSTEGLVVVPARWTRLRSVSGEQLNNGRDDGYISGHCAIYHYKVIKTVPWGKVPKAFTWDILHTRMIHDAGFGKHIEWSDNLKVWDVERGATPWA